MDKKFENNEFKFTGVDPATYDEWEAKGRRPFHLENKHATNDAWLRIAENDAVNSPSHYTKGRVEAIDVIEDAIEEAPSIKAGFLQAQVLKYLLRLWHKIDAKEDAEKARWYLNRLIDSLN